MQNKETPNSHIINSTTPRYIYIHVISQRSGSQLLCMSGQPNLIKMAVPYLTITFQTSHRTIK